MSDKPLIAHSLMEAYLYLKATPCGACGRGPLRGSEARPVGKGDKATVTIVVTCAACKAATTQMFHLPEAEKTDESAVGGSPIINPTDEPSRILDVGQWILLSRMVTEEAGRETDKIRVRSLELQAAQCLEEALKFYDEPDNDLPPPEAFFCETSRVRFRQAPEQFSKQRLLALRSKLPHASRARPRPLVPEKKPWWRRRQ